MAGAASCSSYHYGWGLYAQFTSSSESSTQLELYCTPGMPLAYQRECFPHCHSYYIPLLLPFHQEKHLRWLPTCCVKNVICYPIPSQDCCDRHLHGSASQATLPPHGSETPKLSSLESCMCSWVSITQDGCCLWGRLSPWTSIGFLPLRRSQADPRLLSRNTMPLQPVASLLLWCRACAFCAEYEYYCSFVNRHHHYWDCDYTLQPRTGFWKTYGRWSPRSGCRLISADTEYGPGFTDVSWTYLPHTSMAF